MSTIIQPPYFLVPPSEFNEDQQKFIEKIKETIAVISSQTDLILGAKDVNSRHLAVTEAYSRWMVPDESREFAECRGCVATCNISTDRVADFNPEDRSLLLQGDINKKVSLLNIHRGRDGVHALVLDKQLLKHVPSQSVLGIFFSARVMELHKLFTIIPNFILEFGTDISIEKYQGPLNLRDVKFSEYEHEVCYLVTMNWTCRQIVDFLNAFHPKAVPRSIDTIYKCRNRICDKVGIPDYSMEKLRATLISMGLHQKMPQSFFNRILGSTCISD